MSAVPTPPDVLRPMLPGDLDEVIRLQRDGSIAALSAIFPQEKFPFPTQTVRDRWQRELADDAIACLVVSGSGQGVDGYAAVRGDELLHFGTAIPTWGSGLAGRAHGEVLTRMAGRGVDRAWLWVFEENHRARRFYERRGWTPTGERRRSEFAPHPVLLTYEIDVAGVVGV